MLIHVRISRALRLEALQTRSLHDLLKRSAEVAWIKACPHPDGELSLVLTHDAQLQELNRSFLGIDAATDVLSFPSGEVDPGSGKQYLGDILISYPKAVSQAADGGHSLEAELQLLVVHGMLHLCGYDHTLPEDKSMMWERQAEILHQLDCPIRGPAEEY